MSTTIFVAEYALLFAYIFSYYLILITFVSLMFFSNVKDVNFLTELSFSTNNSFLRLVLVVVFITFAGLPPLFFFLPNFSIIATIVLRGSWFLATCVLSLVFFGWFLYLNAVNSLSTQGWSLSSSYEFGFSQVNTWLSTVLLSFFWILILGWFLFDDFYLMIFWIFV